MTSLFHQHEPRLALSASAALVRALGELALGSASPRVSARAPNREGDR